MRINNNIMAMNTHRQLGINNTAMPSQWRNYHQASESTEQQMMLLVFQFLKR